VTLKSRVDDSTHRIESIKARLGSWRWEAQLGVEGRGVSEGVTIIARGLSNVLRAARYRLNLQRDAAAEDDDLAADKLQPHAEVHELGADLGA
jgi:hypothetical protein